MMARRSAFLLVTALWTDGPCQHAAGKRGIRRERRRWRRDGGEGQGSPGSRRPQVLGGRPDLHAVALRRARPGLSGDMVHDHGVPIAADVIVTEIELTSLTVTHGVTILLPFRAGTGVILMLSVRRVPGAASSTPTGSFVPVRCGVVAAPSPPHAAKVVPARARRTATIARQQSTSSALPTWM